jgi:hypothetical protein
MDGFKRAIPGGNDERSLGRGVDPGVLLVRQPDDGIGNKPTNADS